MKPAVLASLLLLSGCAFPRTVQRIAVDYNSAVGGMANELTLLNILRAKEDLPLHYTSVNRLSGSFTVRGTTSINDAIREGMTTATEQVATTVSATPSTVTTTIKQVQEGVDVITPSIGGEINTGPSFDIAILDTQKFYQGILAAIPFQTVENYLNQGFSDQLLMRLFIERIDFRSAEDADKGKLLLSWSNPATGPEAEAFARQISCYRLGGADYQAPAKSLAPVSRLKREDGDEGTTLTVQELALLDGKSLDLTAPVGKPTDDGKVYVQRISPKRRLADLTLKEECRQGRGAGIPLPSSPPPEPLYLGNFKALVLAEDQASEREKAVQPEIVFRSTESVIRFVGRYLQGLEENRGNAPLLDDMPLFEVARGRRSRALVTTSLLGQQYSIADDAGRRRNMTVLAIIQQLVNLHKESTDRPVTVPVQVVGGR